MILLGHGVTCIAVVKFHDLAIDDALTELGNGIGRLCSRPQHSVEAGAATLFRIANEIGDIHISGQAHIGKSHSAKIFKMAATGIGR